MKFSEFKKLVDSKDESVLVKDQSINKIKNAVPRIKKIEGRTTFDSFRKS